MPFEKGNQLAKGRTKPKEFAEMVRLAVKDSRGDRPKLRHIAEKLVDLACDGELAAIKEVADRLDGKPAQEAHNTNTYDASDAFIECLRMMQAEREKANVAGSVEEQREQSAPVRH